MAGFGRAAIRDWSAICAPGYLATKHRFQGSLHTQDMIWPTFAPVSMGSCRHRSLTGAQPVVHVIYRPFTGV
jgi:hypothetical protein